MKFKKQVVAACLIAGMGMGALGIHESFAARAIVDGAIRRSINTGGVNGNKTPKVVVPVR